MEIKLYADLLSDIKKRIKTAQVKAAFTANAHLIALYWDIGQLIAERQKQQGWAASVIPKLSIDLKNELAEMSGFSERNLGYMIRFSREYQYLVDIEKVDNSILQQPVAKLANSHLLLAIPWGHHALLIEKIKDRDVRFWYMSQTLEQGWSRDTLRQMIKNDSYNRQGVLHHNFDRTLPVEFSELVQQMLKDPYVFDFFTLTDTFSERELELELIKHIEKFLIELGAGFAFVGRQYPLKVSDKEYSIDLLFYHLHLRCYVVVDLKKGEFKPEYAGKMNFYCAVVDDLLRHPSDQETIGLILCQNKDTIIAEYALRRLQKPIGISEYELTRILPENLKSSLPSIEDIEKEFTKKKNKKK
jgi:predicted nuclease of restriction endonuclease-like (RecB) superfamily